MNKFELKHRDVVGSQILKYEMEHYFAEFSDFC